MGKGRKQRSKISHSKNLHDPLQNDNHEKICPNYTISSNSIRIRNEERNTNQIIL